MIHPIEPRPRSADFSRERRRHVIALIRRTGVLNAVTPDAQLLYVVGALICNDAGRFTQTELDHALVDPSVIAAAREILRKAAA